ncbi:MAG: hypothetical protein HQ527_09500 [Cyanobacteria bacterium]|nr:hypothetical protein [Cyanobacteria bacterium bin.51]
MLRVAIHRQSWRNSLICGLALIGLVGCGQQKEVAIQNAKAGDVLVNTEDTQVSLVKQFKAGTPNGLYNGAVTVKDAAEKGPEVLYQVSAVCSMEDLPGWPKYDNLYGHPLTDIEKIGEFSSASRWQILYHYDGRVESKSDLTDKAWTMRLKDNLCRRGDFNDSTAKPKQAGIQ